jgi:hypothetical protein
MIKYYVADLNDFSWFIPIQGTSSLRIEREDADGSFQVQVNENNPHYVEYLEWLEAGNTPEPWIPPVAEGL